MFRTIGAPELIIILVVVLVIFGPKQLPKLGKMFGKTVKEVRTGMDSLNEELKSDSTEDKKEEAKASEETEEKKDAEA